TALSENRLNGYNALGVDIASSINRINYTDEAKNVLVKAFEGSYVDILLSFFKDFSPYRSFVLGVEDLRKKLISEGRSDLEALLFDSQGSLDTFENYVDEVEEEYEEKRSRNELNDSFVKHYEAFKDLNKALNNYLEFLDQSKAAY